MKGQKKKSTNRQGILLAVAILLLSTMTACGKSATPTPPATPTDTASATPAPLPTETATGYTVTFYDGGTVLSTQTVEQGQKAQDYTPEKAGYDFMGWYATPSLNHAFDFTTDIAADVDVFAGFTQYVEDTRVFYVVGSGTSNLLFSSDWGKVIDDAHRMTKAEGKNEYTITLDLLADDEFQFAINSDWHNKRGYGYLASTTLPDGAAAFSGRGGIGETSAKGSNISVIADGNYTFTLTTYPKDDVYDTDNANYTEASKEVYNLGTYDKISFVRNGDVVDAPVITTDFYIKGAGITDWRDIYDDATRMTNTDGVYTLSVYLKAGEEFMFSSTNTVQGQTSTGTTYLRYNVLGEDSKALFANTSSYNMVANTAGTYTFTYSDATGVLDATLDTEGTVFTADYYIDGTFGGQSWNASLFNEGFQLVETAPDSGIYAIFDVELHADDELIIQSYKPGSTETGTWDTPSWTSLGSFNHTYLVANPNFSAVGGTNNNIKVLADGTYTILFNAYSKMINITDGYEVYIKGGMNGWAHNFEDAWKLAQNPENEDLFEITLAFEEGWEAGLAKYNEGETSGNGAWIGRTNLGKAGAANDTFDPGSGGNLVCSAAGTYKIVYNLVEDTVDIYPE